jgi:putative ABC transport system ATP-binding protein
MPGELIQAHGLTKVYRNGDVDVVALAGVDLTIAAGERLAITGSSGSGKSTLLHVLGGVDVPTSGSVILEGRDVATMGDKDRAMVRRRRIGFVFQAFNLLPMLTAEENVALPLSLDGVHKSEASRRAAELLDGFGLLERRSHLPHQLSGGEQQRVAIARALVTRPALLLADEPTGSLDTENGRRVMESLQSRRQNENHALVIVTHDPEIASKADRVIRLRDGRLWARSE